MARLDFRGAAAKCNASGAVGVADPTIVLTGDTSGWPTGASGRDFVAIIDRGNVGKMEKVLCSSLVGGLLTIAQRGYDGTGAQAHDVNATVEHGLNAGLLDDLSGHVYDTTRDDHTQYMVSDTSIRGFADTSGIIDVPVPIGPALVEGTSEKLAAADHVHTIPALFIVAGLLAADAVTTAKILDAAVTAAKIADGSIIAAKFGTGLKPRTICTSSTRPGSPAVGDEIYETDTGKTLYYHGATTGWGPAWNTPWGLVTPSAGLNPRVIVTNQGGITAETDVTAGGIAANITWTAVANRVYRHRITAMGTSDAAAAAMLLKITGSANAELHRFATHAAAITTSDSLAWEWDEVGLAAGATTRKVRAVAGGASTMGLQNATAAFQYSINDVGPNGLPS